jgi:hypothetical protein
LLPKKRCTYNFVTIDNKLKFEVNIKAINARIGGSFTAACHYNAVIEHPALKSALLLRYDFGNNNRKNAATA